MPSLGESPRHCAIRLREIMRTKNCFYCFYRLLLLLFLPISCFIHNRKNSGKFGYLAKKSYLCIRIEELNGLSIRKFTSRTQQCVPTELLLRAKPEATVASESRCGLYAKNSFSSEI